MEGTATRVRHLLTRYAVTLVALAVVTAGSRPFMHTPAPHPAIAVTFLLLLMASAWWGGYGPGILACALAFYVVPYFITPRFSPANVDVTRLLPLVVMSLVISRMAATRAKTESTLRAMNAVLDERVRKRTAELQTTNAALAESEARLKLALQAGRMGAWEWEIRSGKFTWSSELEMLHGREPGSFAGTLDDAVRDAHPEDKPELLTELQRAARERTDFRREYRILRRDGTIAWVEARARFLFDSHGEPERMVGVCADVSDRKGTEFELRTQAEALAQSNADLQHFAYVASHDLREPLRSIASYTQLLGNRYRGRLDEDADTFIGFVIDGVRRMEHLIRDLLTYSRAIHNDFLENEPVPIDEIARTAIKNLKTAIDETGALVVVDPLPEIPCDRVQLTQVFQNLMSNALTYRGTATPEIRVHAEQRAGEWLFSIADNGIGIPEAYHESIFSPFKRLHGREYPGTGIGLAICKRIIDRHRGRIGVESAPGQGSKFYFTIPFRDARLASPLSEQQIAETSGRSR